MIQVLNLVNKQFKTQDNLKNISKKDFLWVLSINPDEAELKKLQNEFDISNEAISEYKQADFSKRISSNPFRFVFVDYSLKKGKMDKSRILYLIKDETVVVIMDYVILGLFDQISDEIKNDILKARASYVIYRLLEEEVDENYDIIKKMEENLDVLEKILVANKTLHPEKVIDLRKELSKFNKSLWASSKMIFNMKNGLIPIKIAQEDQLIMEDIYHTLQNQVEVVFSQKEMLTDFINIHVSNISNNLNGVMKKLTALTLIIAIPTFLVGSYGMNFKNIPFAEHPAGFIFMNLIALGIALITFGYFYKEKWL